MTDNRTTELLCCPFCGGEAFPNIELRKHWVECRECAAESGCYRTEAEAIAAWNSRTPIEYDGWFYLPKPKDGIVVYGEPEITRTENGYKVRQIADVVDEAARRWGEELGDYVMKRICEAWNSRVERTCHIVTTWSDSDYLDDVNYRCSECGGLIVVDERNPDDYFEIISHANYCCNCGAKVVDTKGDNR